MDIIFGYNSKFVYGNSTIISLANVNKNYFNSISDDIWINEILPYLSYSDLCNLAKTNKSLIT